MKLRLPFPSFRCVMSLFCLFAPEHAGWAKGETCAEFTATHTNTLLSCLQELRITEETFRLTTSFFMEPQQDDLNWDSFNTRLDKALSGPQGWRAGGSPPPPAWFLLEKSSTRIRRWRTSRMRLNQRTVTAWRPSPRRFAVCWRSGARGQMSGRCQTTIWTWTRRREATSANTAASRRPSSTCSPCTWTRSIPTSSSTPPTSAWSVTTTPRGTGLVFLYYKRESGGQRRLEFSFEAKYQNSQNQTRHCKSLWKYFFNHLKRFLFPASQLI